MRYLTVRNKKELYNLIIPFFMKHNVNGEKHKYFINLWQLPYYIII